MQFLVFEYAHNDYDNEVLIEKNVPDHINTRDAIIEWLPTIAGAYEDTSYLIVEAKSWDVAKIHKKPITTVAKWLEESDGGEG